MSKKKQEEKTTKTKGVHFNKLDPIERYLLEEAEKINFSNLMKYLFLTYKLKRGEGPPGIDSAMALVDSPGVTNTEKEKEKEKVDKKGITNLQFSLDDDEED